MLYFGIKPVFVFDGKPPALKNATLVYLIIFRIYFEAKRKAKKADSGQTVKRTAVKLLETQMKIAAIDQFNTQKIPSPVVPTRKTDDQYAIHSALKEL